LIKQPRLAKEIVIATKEGTSLPVSVKTRIGFNHVATIDWINHLLEVRPSAITVHGRTQKMMSDGLADWEEIKKAALLKNATYPETLIVGNGDVSSHEDGILKAGQFFTDGIMVGRGIFKNPNMFSDQNEFGVESKIEMLKFHITRFREEWEGNKNYAILKRFYKIYVNGFNGASSLRAGLMNTNNYDEAFQLINSFNNQPQEKNKILAI
jgi:tRNA-dihydrouridine synthase